MKFYVLSILLTLAAITFTACGPDNHHFQIEGRFLKMNQGVFYVYSPDGLINGIDTINVQGGRFGYEMVCEDEGVIVIVLPNFSELPVFVKPGKSVDMKADASHIKDIEITGTDENEQMTQWRQSIDGMSPPDQQKQAENFIRKNPQSIVSHWLLRKYFMLQPTQNIKKAKELIDIVNKAGKASPSLSYLNQGMERMTSMQIGDKLPSFTATDIKGKHVSSSDFTSGKTVMVIWASWNYDGTNLQRRLNASMKKLTMEGKPKPHVLSISLDPAVQITKQTLRHDSVSWPVICDEKIWESPLVKTLGISTIPDNILIVNGNIVARHLPIEEVIKEIEK